jgi:hypothetical protein
MAYRNGTYVAFHAGGTSDQTASDIKYYRTLQMWHANENTEFRLVNSHEKSNSVRDSSLRSTLRTSLLERMRSSKNFLLILSLNTKQDTDWVPFEIAHAVDTYELPIIAAYPSLNFVVNASLLRDYWPNALAERIQSRSASVLHIPFRIEAVRDALSQLNPDHRPPGGYAVYDNATQQRWGYF